jgi:hypothetical protein
MVANDEMLRYWTRVMEAAGAMPCPKRSGTGECLHARLHQKA